MLLSKDFLQKESPSEPPFSWICNRLLCTTAPNGGAELARMALKTSSNWTSDEKSLARPSWNQVSSFSKWQIGTFISKNQI